MADHRWMKGLSVRTSSIALWLGARWSRGQARDERIRSRAFRRDGLVTRVAPFALVGAFAVFTTMIATRPERAGLLLAATVAFIVIVYAALLLTWERLPAWAEVAPPVGGAITIAVLTHAAGGAAAGFVPLYALPIIWVAMHGTRLQSLVVVAVCCAATALPILVIGSPDYPSSEWPQVLINGAVGLLVGATVNGLIGQLAGLSEQLQRLASTDDLTGVSNRRSFDASLALEIERADRSGRPLSLILLDVDHFKAFNDTFGHQAGDDLLVTAAAAWRSGTRPFDTLARYGGEEFVAVMPDCSPEVALAAANRLRNAMPSGQTASAGVATWALGETAAGLIGRADRAMYRAKRSGRNRSIVA